MYFKNYNKLLSQVNYLKKNYNLIGLKAEFEAEGSSNSDINLLRSITLKANTKIFVKIGGVEALNDIYNCLEIGVDGIIAPMVESKFGLHKFVDFFLNHKLTKKPYLTINIETQQAYEKLDEILPYCKNIINNITIGRSDFTASYFNNKLTVDNKFITDKIISIADRAKKYNISTTVGGSLSKKTILTYKNLKSIRNKIKNLETRKVILPTKSFLYKKDAINNAVKLESSYILLKNEIKNFKLSDENNRLTILNTRK
jgi:4-hydroxy-2-oxoheptanedioate aldolase